ncbi:MAG: cation:proton antiporter [bacterium]|nr:cation:proton antiporter [bacterium]
MELPILQDLAILFGISILVAFASVKAKLPALIGYLLTGVMAGPYGLGLIHGVHDVEVLAEIGVILLLFAIGLEFSFKDLLRIKKSVFLGGGLQVTITLGLVAAFALTLGQGWQYALFLGTLVALSSTAIVLKLFQEKGWMDSPYGQNALAILIFQDMAIVPLMLLVPFLAGQGGEGNGLWLLLAKGLGIVVGVFLMSRYVVPFLLYHVARTRSRELFLLTICALGLTVAWATNLGGLSLGLGAFMAGLIISDSDYGTYALSSILPFRDVFSSLFFVSIGMLLNLSYFFENWVTVLALGFLVVVSKGLVVALAGWVLKLSVKTVVILSFALSQIGEFSFVIAKSGLDLGLLEPDRYQLFLSITVMSMALAPLLIMAAPRMAELLARGLMPVFRHKDIEPHGRNKLKDHLIIVGYGVTGQMLSRAAKAAGTSFVVLEMNAETVRREKAQGLPIYFGDSTHEEVLEHLNIHAARILSVAISDPMATAATVRLAKSLNPSLYVIARTRFVNQLEKLYEAGADEVVTAEYEASVEIFARVLHQYMIPQDEIERFVSEVRADGYRMLRKMGGVPASNLNLKTHLVGLEIRNLRIGDGPGAFCSSLKDLDLRARFGVTALAIRDHEGKLTANPPADSPVCPGDEVLILGEPQQLAQAALFLSPPKTAANPA